jgi:V/A-type H+-transporting ATPase subunit D
MARLNPTRINLINLKKRVAVARKGHGILKRKREVLVLEFLNMLRQSSGSRAKLNALIIESYKMVEMASTYVGNFELENVALHMQKTAPVRMQIKNVMGVKIPKIERQQSQAMETSLLFSTSLAVDDISDTFTKAVDSIIEVAQREQGLRRLVLEIDKTKRRVNALDYKVIPGMQAQQRYIRMRLEEIDRDTFSALKHVKKKLARKKEE